MFLLALLYVSDARASPISQDDATLTYTPNPASSYPCPAPDPSRSFLRILWSCATIIISCTWIAVHPNIPARSDSLWIVARRRCQFMLCSLITPGLMLVWAMRQWIGARHIAERYKAKGWTLTHAHFLQMGGFVLHSPEGVSLRPLTPESFAQLVSAGSIDWPSTSAQDIEDRSKDNALAKAVVVLHTTVFVAKCITRVVQGKFLAELEVLGLAFACLNAAMYGLWWDKPLDVRCPIPIVLRGPDVVDLTLRASEEEVVQEAVELQDMGSHDPPSPKRNPITLTSNMYKRLHSFIRPFSDMVDTHSMPDDNAYITHVPSFYAYDPSEGGPSNQTTPVFVSTLISLIFGAIHCLLWLFPPTSTAFTFSPGAAASVAAVSLVELWLWRVSSLILTIIPLLFLALCAYLTGLPLRFVPLAAWLSGRPPLPQQPPSQQKTADKVYTALCGLCLLYAVCRVALFALAFAELRVFVPPDAGKLGWRPAFGLL